MLEPNEIRSLIDADRGSEKKRRAALGQRYYEGRHDILDYRMFYYNKDGKLVEDTVRSNMKIPHPFFTELVDQLAAYMLSFDENPIRAVETADGLQDELDAVFDDAFWAEIEEQITGTNAKGYDYLYAYINDQDRLIFQYADSMGVVEVREQDTDKNCKCVIYFYTDRIDKDLKKIIRIQVHYADQIAYYVQHGEAGDIEPDDEQPINPRPHVVYEDTRGNQEGKSLGFIPFWRLDNNRKQVPGLMPIKAIIDDYDIISCGLTNNLIDFDNPLYAVKGFDGDDPDELFTNLRAKKIVGTYDNGGIEVHTTNIPYEARKAKLEEDEKSIYRFGMGFNSAQAGDGNITNVVIRSRYTLLDLKANKLEKQLKKMLREIIKVVLDRINEQKGTAYQPTDVYFDFVRNVPTNEQENVTNEKTRAETVQLQVNTILNVAANIGDEAVLAALCDVLDLDLDEIKGQLEKAAQETPEAAEGLLNQVVTDDEQEAEASTAGAAFG